MQQGQLCFGQIVPNAPSAGTWGNSKDRPRPEVYPRTHPPGCRPQKPHPKAGPLLPARLRLRCPDGQQLWECEHGSERPGLERPKRTARSEQRKRGKTPAAEPARRWSAPRRRSVSYDGFASFACDAFFPEPNKMPYPAGGIYAQCRAGGRGATACPKARLNRG